MSGWPSMTCIIIFLGGIQLFCIGILGEYLAKTYMETKHQGPYLSVRRQTLSGIRSKKKLLLIIPAAVIVALLVWNDHVTDGA